MIEENTENIELWDNVTKIALSKDISYHNWIDFCISCYDHDNGDVLLYEDREIHFYPKNSIKNKMINMAMKQNKMFFIEHFHIIHVFGGEIPEFSVWDNPNYLTKKKMNFTK